MKNYLIISLILLSLFEVKAIQCSNDSTLVSLSLVDLKYQKAESFLNTNENIDSAYILLKSCDSILSSESPTLTSFSNQLDLYISLMTLTRDKKTDEYLIYFKKSLKYGFDDWESLTFLYEKYDAIEDSELMDYFKKINLNILINNAEDSIENIFFRYIFFLDQF